MIDDLDIAPLRTTDGEIAFINLESARLRSWDRFWPHPERSGIAEATIEYEQLKLQFAGDASALGRLDSLARCFAATDATSARSMLIQAKVASMAHRFADARYYLAKAESAGAPPAEISDLRLTIDQACGENLDSVLDARRKAARNSGRLQDLVSLGALLADLREFAAADQTYIEALRSYQDVSPFPVAWVCFQLGMLWGELAAEPQGARAAQWYRKAIDHLPGYTKARVHLAEIYTSEGALSDAEALLAPALSSGDPEVHWRLSDVLASQGKKAEAEEHMQAARNGFQVLLSEHLLAFADHGAEFYSGGEANYGRALHLARVNVGNRPTLGAYEQAHAIAVESGDGVAAFDLLAAATERWGSTAAFRSSLLAKSPIMHFEGTAA